VEQRRIPLADLDCLQEWVKTQPHAPTGDWYKDFGSFKLCGSGEYPKTFLTKEMKAHGAKLD
jgi:hypothetical protein